MSLQWLHVEDVRCIAEAELKLDARCNLISGPNASGKTTLLEAIFLLGRGRSFRSPRIELLIRDGRRKLRVVGRLHDGRRHSTIGIEADRQGNRARVDGRSITSLAELAVALPVQAIDPDVHRLIEGAPAERRRFIDWGVFHVEPSFVDHWRRYQKALRQRNAALKSGGGGAAIRAWDPELIAAGDALTLQREKYLDDLGPWVDQVARRLLGAQVHLEFRRGWSSDLSLAQALEAAWSRDVERKLTHTGPHRAELVVRLGPSAARDRVSRGQQKLLAASMLLGQLHNHVQEGGRLAALLVDDPAAELDPEHLERFIREVQSLPSQLFVTALAPDHPALARLKPGRRFHVEHGRLTALV